MTLALAFVLLACGQNNNRQNSYQDNGNQNDIIQTDKKISIVCTVFPQYDWVRQILGHQVENVELTLLQSSKADLHNFQPSVKDIIGVSTCDLFIYIGGESDKWADDAIKEAVNQNMISINLLDTLGANIKEEELIEGMEEGDDGHDDGEPDYDEHVWLSLKNAKVFCIAITNALSTLDADNAGEYRNNLNTYTTKLSALDEQYQAAVNNSSGNTLLFADRFPFRYLMDDYNLDYYAAFSGCHAETEASFKTIIFLANKVDELNLNNVIVTESSDQSIAKTIISNTRYKNQRILVMDAMQSLTSDDVSGGTTYLSIMEGNLNTLKEALK